MIIQKMIMKIVAHERLLALQVTEPRLIFAQSPPVQLSINPNGMRQQRWLPMPAVLNMLYVTRSTVGFVFGNQYAVTSLFDSPVMTLTASCFRGGAIDRIERLMTAGT